MFHTKNQIKKIRDLHIGAGVLIYRSGSTEVCETEFFINRKTGKLCYVKTGQEIEFRTVQEEL